jgi:rhamnose transport system ATP-binding protein
MMSFESDSKINPDATVRDLNIPDRQIVEIARALVRSASVLLLDEPTAALSPFEAAKLLELIRRLREQRVAIVYISHRMDEVLEIADRISVLRDGRKVAELRPSEATREIVVAQILGQELVASHFEKQDDSEAYMVQVDSLSNGKDLRGVTFGVPKGRIIGFFGLLGAGQNSVARSLFGLDSRAAAKRCTIEDTEGLPFGPRDAIARSVGYVPADRGRDGLALGLSVLENVLLASMQRLTTLGFIRRRLARRVAKELTERFDVRMAGLDQPVGHLSGGNQQKVVLAKWAAADVRILLLEEPTRGIDVGAKAEIYRDIRKFTRRGDRCCLLFSSDAEEVAIACDSAFVLRNGKIAARLAGANLSATRLVKEALG